MNSKTINIYNFKEADCFSKLAFLATIKDDSDYLIKLASESFGTATRNTLRFEGGNYGH